MTVASKMVELYKIDDSKLHSTFQFIMNKYEAFDRKCLEIENRMVKYNQHLRTVYFISFGLVGYKLVINS